MLSELQGRTEDLSIVVTRVMGQLVDALRQCMDALPERPRHANDLKNLLGLDYKLSWQVFAVLQAPEPLSVVSYVPGPIASARLIQRAQTVGVPAPVLDGLRKAFDAFESLICHYAADRTAFASLVNAAAPESYWHHFCFDINFGSRPKLGPVRFTASGLPVEFTPAEPVDRFVSRTAPGRNSELNFFATVRKVRWGSSTKWVIARYFKTIDWVAVLRPVHPFQKVGGAWPPKRTAFRPTCARAPGANG